ncbi:MAG: LuxE/PaaK family acyltransferase [Peptoanaerobacter stomatis]
MKYDDVLKYEPFSLTKAEKQILLSKRLNYLTKLHYEKCDDYRKILDFLGFDKNKNYDVEEQIFLPIRLFKELDLKSIPDDEIFKKMTSSGTTGQQVSKIYLDRATSLYQQKTLIKIMSSIITHNRMPMIIIDTKRVVSDPNFISARKSGILGFSLFAKDKIFALDDNMNLDIDLLEKFLEKHKNEDIFIFGYTFIIWQYFYEQLKNQRKQIDLSNSVILHGGGWKKLKNLNISDIAFKESLNQVANIKRISEFYGMAEQTGSIYITCEHGNMHTSTYSDIIIRRKEDFSICDIGEKGIIQLISLIPESYPGHNILTEDEGVILGEDDCPCNRKGKYFKILGRIQNAEIRGCSDTYERK